MCTKTTTFGRLQPKQLQTLVNRLTLQFRSLPKKNLITTKQTQTTEESDTAKQTPLESNITAGTLAKTYYYHFDNNVPERVRTVFEQAVAKYNATGIVKLVPGQGTKKNKIKFASSFTKKNDE